MKDEKKPGNIEPLEESDLKDEIEQEIITKKKEELKALNKKVHEGGEAEIIPEEPLELEDLPSHLD